MNKLYFLYFIIVLGPLLPSQRSVADTSEFIDLSTKASFLSRQNEVIDVYLTFYQEKITHKQSDLETQVRSLLQAHQALLSSSPISRLDHFYGYIQALNYAGKSLLTSKENLDRAQKYLITRIDVAELEHLAENFDLLAPLILSEYREIQTIHTQLSSKIEILENHLTENHHQTIDQLLKEAKDNDAYADSVFKKREQLEDVEEFYSGLVSLNLLKDRMSLYVRLVALSHAQRAYEESLELCQKKAPEKLAAELINQRQSLCDEIDDQLKTLTQLNLGEASALFEFHRNQKELSDDLLKRCLDEEQRVVEINCEKLLSIRRVSLEQIQAMNAEQRYELEWLWLNLSEDYQ